MRIFLWLFALLASAIGLAVTAHLNPGNVVLFYPPHRIDLSLNLAALLAALLFLVLHLLLRAVGAARSMPGRVAAYRQQRREREGNKALRDALKALFEGRFGHAEKFASRAAELPENAGLAGLIGARAAHRMSQGARRDAWLARMAHDGSLKSARLLTIIELLVDDHKPEAALSAVKELNASGTRHIHALQWALKANQQAKNWPEVLRLVRSLDKHRGLHPALSRRLRELAYEDLLGDRTRDGEAVARIWAGVPADERRRPYVAVRAAGAFNARGMHAEARELVEKALTHEWDDRLVCAYRESAAPEGSPDLLHQIERCEAWQEQRPTDAELVLTLGTLCLRQKLWGKAQRHLEQALSDAAEPRLVRDAHFKLAQMHEALAQPELAAAHYRKSAIAGGLQL